MTIQEYHNRIDFLCDKWQTGYFPPEEKDMALDMASAALFESKQRTYGTDTASIEALAPFMKTEWVVPAADGQVNTTLPVERLVAASVRVMSGDNPYPVAVPVLTADELPDRLRSQVTPVTIQSPVLIQETSGGYRLYTGPSGSSSAGPVQVWYLRYPTKPHFNYTIGTDDYTFNPVGSTAPEWNQTEADQVIIRAIGRLGINLDNRMLSEVGLSDLITKE